MASRAVARAAARDFSYAWLTMAMETAGVVRTCVNHPGVETRLTCSSCDDPICPRCMVATAVGQKCPRCARQSGRAKGTPGPPLLARALGAGVAVAAAGAYLMLRIFPIAGLLVSAIYGYVVGSAVRWAARRRTHPTLAAAAVASVVVGVLGVALALGMPLFHPQVIVIVLLGSVVAYGRAAGRW
jgi:hypothetical protein